MPGYKIEEDLSDNLGDVLEEDVPEGGIPEGIWATDVKDVKYTGSKHIQTIRVYDHKTLLREKVHDTVVQKNNIKGYEYTQEDYEAFHEEWKKNPDVKSYGSFDSRKAPQVIIRMKGNYAKNVSVYYQIIKPDLSEVGNHGDFYIDDRSIAGNTYKLLEGL